MTLKCCKSAWKGMRRLRKTTREEQIAYRVSMVMLSAWQLRQMKRWEKLPQRYEQLLLKLEFAVNLGGHQKGVSVGGWRTHSREEQVVLPSAFSWSTVLGP